MSSLVIERKSIDEVNPHPNADRLELAVLGGWQTVVPKGVYTAGDVVVYIPPDSILPVELSDRLGVTGYLSKGRVKCARLRGEPSFGLVMQPTPDMPKGDLAQHLGITKYVPPPPSNSQPGGKSGRTASDHPKFPKYTDLENLRHYPDTFTDGELVAITEKIHGTNCRVGFVDGKWMAGSRNRRVEVPVKQRTGLAWLWQWLLSWVWLIPDELDAEACASSWFTYPLSLPEVRDLLLSESFDHRGKTTDLVLYGEVFGKVQSLNYGVEKLAFRAFDLSSNGKYMAFDGVQELCWIYDVDFVPVLYEGPYSLETVKAHASGATTLDADHIREGVVVRPLVFERRDTRGFRRVLKYVSDAYLLGPDGLDAAEDPAEEAACSPDQQVVAAQ